MNTIDIIVCVILVYALIKGWSGGILVQLAGIVGILVGFWAATFCTDFVAELLKMENASYQLIYIVTLIIIMVSVAILLKLIDRFLKSIGFSLLLRILGVIFSVGKWVLLLALLLSVYLTTMKTFSIAPNQLVTESIFFEPLKYVDKQVFPYIAHAKDLIPEIKPQKKQSDSVDKSPVPDTTKVQTIDNNNLETI